MNFNSIDDIKANGFLGFKKLNKVFNDKSSIPKIKGVYLILYLDNTTPRCAKSGDFAQ